mgnify:CR=1 FL=1
MKKGGVIMELGERVKLRREQLGMSQEQLALKMGYTSRTSINKIENGRPCSQKIIARLANALNVSVPYLMGWLPEDLEEEKNKLSENGEFSDKKKKLIDFVLSVPDEKAEKVLQVMQLILQDD